MSEVIRSQIKTFWGALPFLFFVGACGDTGQERISYPLFASGVSPAPFQVDDWEVTLTEARLLFGPVFFCASVIASAELCPVAQAEFTEAAEVDLLDPTPQPLGEVSGLAGVINSLIYDYGFTWFVSQDNPELVSDALNGHSVLLQGQATRADGASFSFEAALDLIPSLRGGFAVQLGGTRANIESEEVRLDVSFDVTRWISKLDLDALAATGVPNVVLEGGSTAHNSLVLSATANDLPSFVWSGGGLLPLP